MTLVKGCRLLHHGVLRHGLLPRQRLSVTIPYEVRAAENGRLALHAIAQWPPDVIVLDRHMPSMDGEEFARIYRSLPPPHAPIVLLTGDVQPEAAGERVGAAAVVVKPFNLDDLLAAVTWVAQERALPSI